VKAPTTTQAPLTVIVPTTVKQCPAASSGNAQTIAQRVLCAFEGGNSKLDAEKAFITDAVRLGLESGATASPGQYNSVQGTAPAGSTQSTVSFSCPVDPSTKQTVAKAVKSFNVDTSQNKVVAALLCDGTTRFA
jgi:hypothetical protein